jgi:hypothetical protein
LALDPKRIHTAAERHACRLRCPDCHAPLALTWRRARAAGRSEDLFTIAKASCPNRCEFDAAEVA